MIFYLDYAYINNRAYKCFNFWKKKKGVWGGCKGYFFWVDFT